ncbi:MAG TPA: hypothetical protein VIH82_00670, partial [Acidimicrobiia bacterium]
RRLDLSVIELPVVWTAVEGSSVRRVTDSARAAVDVLRIAARWTPRSVARTVRRPSTARVPADG